MKNPYEKLLSFEALNLEPNTTINSSPCPECGHKNFSLSRMENGVLYNCFRAKCGIRGFIPLTPTDVYEPTKHKVKEYKPIETRTLNETEYRFFLDKFDLSRTVLDDWGVCFSHSYCRVVFPIRDFIGREIGKTLRGYKEIMEYEGNKTLHFKYSDSVPFAYYSPSSDRASTVVIVEDPVSCIKLTTAGFDCIALLGTNFSQDLVKLLRGKTIYLWLDADAIHKSAKYRKEYQMFFRSIMIISSVEDPKDLSYKEIIERLNGAQNTQASS